MRTYIALLAAICCLAVSFAPAWGRTVVAPRTLQRRTKPGISTHALSISALAADISTLDCGEQTSSCSDCSTVLTCTKLGTTYRPLSTTTCSGDTPYCAQGQCVADLPDDECITPPTPTTDFLCNGDGYYPAPDSCKKYYLCVDGDAYEYDCSDYGNTVYSHARAMCVPTAEATCSTVSCKTATIGTYQAWKQDPSVYFVCVDTVAADAYVAACPTDYQINADGDCELSCLREGRLANENNDTQYYECIQTATNTFTDPMPNLCPTGSKFDAATERCVSTNQDDGSSAADSGTAGSGTISGTGYYEDLYEPSADVSEDLYRMPVDFKVGSASAAYQIEGAWNEDGKGLSIQDVFFHSRPALDNGDVACDSYHQYNVDIEMLQALQMQTYRFSLSWPRLLPTGASDNVNQPGVDYYNNLIDGLIAVGIEPIVTLYHYDLPQVYQNDGGWLVDSIQDRFLNYSDFVFSTFGDRVKTWVLVNEPHIFCNNFENGGAAPGIALPGTGQYLCAHNMLLAHARAYRLYDTTYRATQNGIVGSSFDLSFSEPKTASAEDAAAADRNLVFGFAWLADPLLVGDYPAEMRATIDENSFGNGLTQSRLPTFTAEEKQILKGTLDFIGLNHYTTSLISPGTATSAVTEASVTNDTNIISEVSPAWKASSRSYFTVCPWGLRGVLNWIYKRYAIPILITENGYAGFPDEYIDDAARTGYYSGYLRAALRARNEDGVDLMGFTAWSLMDNLEWSDGYSMRFGLVHIDYDSPNRTRTLKSSSSYFQQALTSRYAHFVASP